MIAVYRPADAEQMIRLRYITEVFMHRLLLIEPAYEFTSKNEILLTGHISADMDPYTPTVFPTLSKFLAKVDGYPIIGVETRDIGESLGLYDHPFGSNVVYLIGRPTTGLPRHLRELCVAVVYVDTPDGGSALSTDIVGALTLYDRHVKMGD